MGEEAAGAVALRERPAIFGRHTNTEGVLFSGADSHEAAIGSAELGRQAIVYVKLLVHCCFYPR